MGGLRIGLGLAALGRPGYINLGHADDLEHRYGVGEMEARAHAVLDAAWAAGVRYFDAARSYGRAEEFLGSWLRRRGIAPAAAFIASKWGYTYTANWSVVADRHEVKDHSLAVLRRQILETRERLGDHLALYQIHSATLDSGVLDDRQVLGELDRLRAGGLAIGLSVSGPQQGEAIRRALAVEVGGERLFSAVQATWNLLETAAGAALAEAHAAGLRVVVKEALANGQLSPRAPAAEIVALARTARRLGCAVDALALAAALSQTWVDVVLSGAATVEHLESNLAAAVVRLDAEAWSELAALAEPSETYWRKRASLRWN